MMKNKAWMELGDLYVEVMEELDRFSEQEPIFSDICMSEEESKCFIENMKRQEEAFPF